MGLLDSINLDDPKINALMGLGQGLLASGGPSAAPVSVGQGLAAGLGGMQKSYRDAITAQQANQLNALKIKQAQQEYDDSQAVRNFDFGKYYKTPQQQAMEKFGGPTIAALDASKFLEPMLDQKALIAGLMDSKNPKLMQQGMAMLTKDETPITLAEGAKLITRGGKEIASNPKGDIKNGYLIPDGKGGWRIDPALFAAEKELKAAGSTQVKMNPVYQVGNSFGETVAKAGADRLMAQVEAANAAPKQVQAAQQINAALDSGKVMAGPGTSWRVAANQLFGSNQDQLNETRKVIQGFAQLALDSRQSLKGQGPITDFEQKMLKSAASGDIDGMSVGEIRLISDWAIRNGMQSYQQGQKASAALRGMPEFGRIAPAFDLQPMPSSSGGQSIRAQADAILNGGK